MNQPMYTEGEGHDRIKYDMLPFMSTSIVAKLPCMRRRTACIGVTDKSLVFVQWGTVGSPQIVCKIFMKL